MKKGIYVIVGTLAVLGLLIGGFASTTNAEPKVIKWRGQSSFPPGPKVGRIEGASYGLAGYKWADWITKATNGRLTVELAPPPSIFPVAQTFKAISQGVVPVAMCWGSYYSGTLPEGDIEAQLPFAFETIQDVYTALYQYGLYEVIKDLYAKHNIYWIPFANAHLIGFGTTFPVPGPEAIKGKVFRSAGVQGEVVRMLGGKPVPIPWGEMYQALKLGTIDGMTGGISALEGQKLKEVLKYYVTKPSVADSIANILINMDAFNALPEDIKEMIDRDSRYVVSLASSDHFSGEDYIAENVKRVKMVEWSAEDIAKVRKMAIETIWPKLGKRSPTCKKMIDIIIEFEKDYGKF